MTSYNEMYSWMRRIVDNVEVSASDRTSLAAPTYSQIILSILSSHNNQTKQVKFYDCIPTSLGDITFESTASGTEFITFAVSFRFTYFDLV